MADAQWMRENGYQSVLVANGGNAPENWSPTGGGSSGGGGSFEDTIAKAIQMQKDAYKPAIESLKASIPETQARYASDRTYLEGQQAPLEERYKNLLESITNDKTTSLNRNTLTTSQEFGKRGVPLSSGVYGQELNNVLNPIEQQYTTLYKDTSLQRETDIKALQKQLVDLGFSETEALRAINTSIAQMEAGAASAGISSGTNQYNAQTAADQWQQNFGLQKTAADQAYESNALDIAQKQLNLKNSTSGGSNIFGTGTGTTEAMPTKPPIMNSGKIDVSKPFSEGLYQTPQATQEQSWLSKLLQGDNTWANSQVKL